MNADSNGQDNMIQKQIQGGRSKDAVSTRTNAMPQISQADIDTFSSKGYVVIPNFIPWDLVEELCENVRDLCSNNAFHEAKIGQDSTNERGWDEQVVNTLARYGMY